MSGTGRVAVIDCQVAGVSGDMIVGALLDLGADPVKVVGAMEAVGGFMGGCKSLEVKVEDVVRGGFHAKRIEVEAEEASGIRGVELVEATMNCLESLELSVEAKRFASNSINTLVAAEARVHGVDIDEVHLHESGSTDTPAEIIGAAAALDNLNLFDAKVYSTPVAVGGGLFRFSHGTVSSPAPAAMEILRSKGFPLIGGPVESELATPTGVSILVNLAREISRFYPMMKPTAIGYGAGKKDFAEMPNILRVMLGSPLDYQSWDEVSVLETNLDDVSGEILGYTLDKLLREGAKDVSIIPTFTKKNRPGHVIKVIVDQVDAERLSRLLMEETGTLGVRVYPCRRYILSRESLTVDVQIDEVEEPVKVKVARDCKGEIMQIKPEYDDVERIAWKTGKPLREIMELARTKARRILLEG